MTAGIIIGRLSNEYADTTLLSWLADRLVEQYLVPSRPAFEFLDAQALCEAIQHAVDDFGLVVVEERFGDMTKLRELVSRAQDSGLVRLLGNTNIA